MKKLALLLLLLLLLAGSANLHVAKTAQLAVYPPDQQSSIEGRHLSSSSHNGDVFVGAGGTTECVTTR